MLDAIELIVQPDDHVSGGRLRKKGRVTRICLARDDGRRTQRTQCRPDIIEELPRCLGVNISPTHTAKSIENDETRAHLARHRDNLIPGRDQTTREILLQAQELHLFADQIFVKETKRAQMSNEFASWL